MMVAMDKPKHRRVVLRSNGGKNKVAPSDDHAGSFEELLPRTHFDGLPAMPSPVFSWQPKDVLLTSTPGGSGLPNTTPRRPHTVEMGVRERRLSSSSSSGDSDEVFRPRMASSIPTPIRNGDVDKAPLSYKSARSRRKTSVRDGHTPTSVSSRANAPATPSSLPSEGSLNSSLHVPLLTSSLRKGGIVPSVDTQWERGGLDELEAYFPDHRVRIFTATWNMHEERELPSSLDDILLPNSQPLASDVYVIGTQESTPSRKEWEVLIQQTLGPNYVMTSSGFVQLCALKAMLPV